MKKQFNLLLLLITIFSFSAIAQDKKMPSPPAKATGAIDGVTVTIDYHQPSARGRKMLGGINPYGEVWRTGANATTSIDFSANAKVEGQALPKGKYGLYTIPGENEWVIIINKDIKWGHYDYTDKADVLRVKVKPSKTASFVETFTISVKDGNVVMEWENTSVSFKISKG
ncbi:MAG: DUF2911 domain-containing protein [Cytophagales bacterium]|jgi:hypothetical protein|nr:DUF2911 domain-containing protein [Cytophagales bacterium]MCE2893853.1 DUF2911 domain-containing protein [Flammeovirgaceae bacterium]MCA6365490.1 DUF2911 domain-containing protein [Cytophagales bacterium]MCA6370356.1 DUF2911 domain-containing protein [Cytophagales bacterium]MCA6376464.1 DUF2911 domain-containing protein [Cytophagales bacterium]